MKAHSFWLALLLLLAGAAAAGAQSASPPPGTTTDEVPPKVTLPSGRPQSEPDAVTDAETQIESRSYPAAIKLLDPYLSSHANDARALFDRGYVEDAQGNPEAAEKDYRRAITADAKQFEARLALGMDLAAAGKMDEAREQLEAATRLTPEPPNPAAQAQAYRAEARVLRSSDPDQARAALFEALKLSPESPADIVLTAEIAEAAGDTDVAAQAYDRALARDPRNLDAAAGLAHLLIQQKKYQDAEPLLRQALRTTPEDPVLNAQLATVLSAQDKQPEAIAILERLHQSVSTDLHITAMLADLYTQAGDAKKADPLYVQLLAAAPQTSGPDPSLLAARGNNLIRQQRYPEAIPVLEQATKLDPRNGDAWSGLAFAASETHQPQLTLDALVMRSKVMSDTPSTYFLSATAYDTLHQTKFAVEKYKQFLATAGGRFPDQEWQAKHRLVALEK